MEFVATNLPIILLFVFGMGLLIVEAFMPGFGLPGITGSIMEIAVIVLTYINHGGLAALGVTVCILAIMGIVVSLVLRSASKGRLSRSPMVLNDTQDASVLDVSEDLKVFIGKEGVTTTVLRPIGMAEFDGMRLNVEADGEFIPKDTPVTVHRVDGRNVIVRKLRGE
jgi:membrane-bound ClpP family serine protease